jgi:GH15 family glucan-1,4-alpha-glucosidase
VANGRRQLPVQEDETGLVIWALCRHLVQYKDVEWFKPFYRDVVTRGADWMAGFRDIRGMPWSSWDLWEERYGIHAFSVAATWAGLQMASVVAEKFNDLDYARKWREAAAEIKAAADRWLWRDDLWRFARNLTESGDGYQADTVLDASLYGLWYFGMYAPDDPRIVATMEAVRERLSVKTAVGGIARYENDWYHQVTPDVTNVPGNPWFICTIWLAEWHIALATTPGDLAPAAEILEWVVDHALPSGVLAEQVHPFTNAPMSVSPLTWSHAAFVTAVLNYVERLAVLRGVTAGV